MRDSFVNELYKIACNDRKIKIVTGDLGFGVLKPFYQNLPSCFVNAGIAEQNMTSFAAGMAYEGFKPVTYSIGNFPTLRCLEQIRNDICYSNANVKIVCVGAGFSYGVLGSSHHATEDIGIMRTLPNLIILSPCDREESILCTRFMMNVKNPCYLRLGRNGAKTFINNSKHCDSLTINKILDGTDCCIFCTGEIIEEAVAASEKLLNSFNISIAVYSCPLLKPFPKEELLNIIKSNHFKAIFTLEEHNVINGLGTIITECFDLETIKPRIIKLGINDKYYSDVGDQKYLRKIAGIDCDSIVKKVLSLYH